MSNNSSRTSTSARSKTNSDDDSLFPSSSQLTKNGKSDSSENKRANYVLSFCDWAMGTMSESCYDNPHQERCAGKMCGAKMPHCKHEGCEVRVHNVCQIDWLTQHRFEMNHDDPIFLPTARVLPELCSIMGKAISCIRRACVRRVDVCLSLPPPPIS